MKQNPSKYNKNLRGVTDIENRKSDRIKGLTHATNVKSGDCEENSYFNVIRKNEYNQKI